jgi:cold shock CspA family protein
VFARLKARVLGWFGRAPKESVGEALVSSFAAIPQKGKVTAFDDDGWGTVTDEAGAQRRFHSTAIAGGGRQIEVGAAVTFVVVAGRNGEFEATAITPSA